MRVQIHPSDKVPRSKPSYAWIDIETKKLIYRDFIRHDTVCHNVLTSDEDQQVIQQDLKSGKIDGPDMSFPPGKCEVLRVSSRGRNGREHQYKLRGHTLQTWTLPSTYGCHPLLRRLVSNLTDTGDTHIG